MRKFWFLDFVVWMGFFSFGIFESRIVAMGFEVFSIAFFI